MATTAPPALAPATHLSHAGRCVLAAAVADPQPAARGLGITTQNVLNLARLAAYLGTLPPDYQEFCMVDYMAAPQDRSSALAQPLSAAPCGTVACAVGHGPAAGIPAHPHEEWHAYEKRTFISTDDDAVYYQLWDWLFDSGWATIDNTPGGAAARICYALQHGLAGVEAVGVWSNCHREYLPQ